MTVEGLQIQIPPRDRDDAAGDKVLKLKAGYVIDNLLTKQHEVVHTFGWYMRKYVAETKAKGATPIVCSLVPRKIWQGRRPALRPLLGRRRLFRSGGDAFPDLCGRTTAGAAGL